jgi:hypothetical protein
MAVAKISTPGMTRSNGVANRSPVPVAGAGRSRSHHHHHLTAHIVGLEFALDGAPCTKLGKGA